MRLSRSVLFLCIFGSSVCAANNKANIGSKTYSQHRDGRYVHRIETTPERNPLPASANAVEQERSVPIAHSGFINSTVRWTSSHATSIANDVAINANGGNPFIGWNLNVPRVSFHNDASATPLWEFPSDPQVFRNFVALSANANIVANSSFGNIYLLDKISGIVTFSFAIPDGRIGGPVAVSRDGTLLVCAAATRLQGGTNRVYAFAPPSTVPLWTFDFSDAQSTGIYGINISIDKSTVIVNGKFYAWVLNASNGAVRTQMEINNTESRVAMSRDASVLAVAELNGFVKSLQWNTSQNRYTQLWLYRVPPGAFTNWASAVDVSADGLTIMAGTLMFLSAGYDGSIYMFDTFGDGIPNWVVQNVGDEVAQVALSDDGSFGAAATWGDLANARPDIYIFERESNVPVFSVNTPGSMFSIAISADGKSVIAGGKAVHARQFGNGGNAYNIGVDLGGGAISGTVTGPGLVGGGALVEVLGTTRRALSDSSNRYVVSVPAGTYSVRYSKRGYSTGTITGVTVVSGDTTFRSTVLATLAGTAPTNLVASHSQNSRIQLTWTNPLSATDRNDRLLAADEYIATSSVAVRPSGGTKFLPLPSTFDSPIPPDSIRIYRGIRSGGPYYLKRTIAGTQSTYNDSAAIALRDYYYRVTALYGQGESVYSNEAYGTVDSSFLQLSITTPHRATTPTIDGTISPGEWTDALRIDASDVFGLGGGVALPRGSVWMYFKYDSIAQRLYIAGEDLLNTDGVQNSEGFGLYFDDNNNDRFEPLGTSPLLREGNYWAYFFSAGPTVRFREIYTGGGINAIVDTVNDALTAFTSSGGRVTGEVSIPLGFFNKNHLQVYGPDRKVGGGLFMISRDGTGSAIFHGWWPQTMVGVFTPSGFGDIQIPIRMLAPPKAPANPAAVKQGNFLRVTWTDPALGLNNDPLTVPVTLELYRNGALYRQFPRGVQTFTDSNVVAQEWYEYRLRGSIVVSSQTYFGPFTQNVGSFAVSDPRLTEFRYDDGVPEAFYVVDFTYDGNRFATRFTPRQYPARVYRVKAMTNNGFSPIDVTIHEDSAGVPGRALTGKYSGESFQTSGIDSFIVTLTAGDPPTITGGDFHVVLSYLPASPGAPGIGGDLTQPIAQRSKFFTNGQGWQSLANADLIVSAFLTGQPNSVSGTSDVPAAFSLSQNYPNPFNPVTKLQFSVADSRFVSLKVFDILGREVATLVHGELLPGKYEVPFDASRHVGIASGIYFYRLSAGSFVGQRKMLLLR